LVCISCLLLLATWRSVSQKGKEPPGPFSLPIVGNILQLNVWNVPESLKKLSKKYGPVFTVHLGPRKAVVLYGYDVLKEALIDQGDDFSGRGILPLMEKLFQGIGMSFEINGESWKQLRRFAITTLRDFGMGKKGIEDRIQEEAHFLVERLKSTHGRIRTLCLLVHAVSNIICSIVFGDRFEYEDKKFLT
ncbi:CP2H1 protein, partial [Onychorhynchus coronatus]|nr:CP2H1 protein [Onychorhynchus coronatus]